MDKRRATRGYLCGRTGHTPRGMSAHSGDTSVRINVQGTLTIVPWMPTLAGTLAT